MQAALSINIMRMPVPRVTLVELHCAIDAIKCERDEQPTFCE